MHSNLRSGGCVGFLGSVRRSPIVVVILTAFAAPLGSSVEAAEDVAGLYTGTKYGLAINPIGAGPVGSGTWGVQVDYYLLSRDGRVFHARTRPDVPGGDFTRFDFETARRQQPGDNGTYTLRGKEIVLAMGDPRNSVTATRVGPDELEINRVRYTRTLGSPTQGNAPQAPGPASAPATQPGAASPASAIPGVIEGLPTLAYRAPPGFTEPSGFGFHEAKPYWHARVEVYDFRRFLGKNFEPEFRATLFREWIAADRREDRLVGEPEFAAGAVPGAEQAVTAVFAEEFEGPRLGEGDRRTPRLRIRTAILAAGAVALVEMVVRDRDAYQKHQASLAAFTESLEILAAPPPTTRDEIATIAGVWEWDGNPVPKSGPLAFLHEARARMECYVFSVEGRVAWRGKPSGDIRRYDFEAAKAVSAASVGTYFKRADRIVLRFGEPPYYVYHADIRAPDTLEILGYTYRRTQR